MNEEEKYITEFQEIDKEYEHLWKNPEHKIYPKDWIAYNIELASIMVKYGKYDLPQLPTEYHNKQSAMAFIKGMCWTLNSLNTENYFQER